MPGVFKGDSFTDGLLPRFLLIIGDNKPQKFSRLGIDKEGLEYWKNLLNLCYKIPLQLDDLGFAQPKILTFKEEAIDSWSSFYNELMEIQPFLSGMAKVFIPKLITHSLKLAGILHIINTFTNVKEIKDIKVFLNKEIVEQAIWLTRFYAGQAMKVLSLYQPKEDKFTEVEERLIKTLYGLQNRVSNGQLSLKEIVENFNSQLPEKLQLTAEKVSSMLRRNLGLTTTPGTHNLRALVWEAEKLEDLFSKVEINSPPLASVEEFIALLDMGE